MPGAISLAEVHPTGPISLAARETQPATAPRSTALTDAMSTHSRHSTTVSGSASNPTPDTTLAFKEPIQINFDGSQSEGTHTSAIGFTLTDATGTLLVEHSAEIDYTTSVQTELHALRAALERARELGARHLRIAGDCTPVLDLVRGDATTSKQTLKPLVTKTQHLLGTFEESYLEYTSRDENTRPDALAHSASDPSPASD